MSTTLNPVLTSDPQTRPARARATFLMCPPTLYDVDYVINPWMSGNVHASSRQLAETQWTNLYSALAELADILLIDPVPGSPDMVFTANAGLERNGIVAVSSFFHPERQAEEQHFRRWFEEQGYKLLDLPREAPFEGEGDALFSSDMSRLWIGEGPRTDASSHRVLADAWQVELCALRLIDPRFYHLDTCFAPLSDGSVMYFPQAFDAASRRAHRGLLPPLQAHPRRGVRRRPLRLQRRQRRSHGRPQHHQPRHSAINSRPEVSTSFRSSSREFLKAGGAAKCLVMTLRH